MAFPLAQFCRPTDKFKRHEPVYPPFEVLHDEALQVDLFTKMLQQGQTLRRERKALKLLNAKLSEYYDKFNDHILKTELLLEEPKGLIN
jgi:hypothetical protein